jgi:hypothetical protein
VPVSKTGMASTQPSPVAVTSTTEGREPDA